MYQNSFLLQNFPEKVRFPAEKSDTYEKGVGQIWPTLYT
jgi:hypothetical protein